MALDSGNALVLAAAAGLGGTTLTLSDNTRISFVGVGGLEARVFG